MTTIYYDPPFSDQRRREELYQGQLLVYSPRKSTLEFIEFARRLIKEAFEPYDPETAQLHLPVERYADILVKLKPTFIHHPESKALMHDIFTEMGCDLGKTYFDVPKMRSSTSDNYLTTGIAYAWHPHRDTWYSAPPCQINWWIPIYDIVSSNAMAFHPQYWNVPVKNSSEGYNYYLWNQQNRGSHVGKFLKEDPRPLPKPTEPLVLDPQIRLIVQAGGIILFSGAQMHSSVPNTSGKTRFSIDFRVVNLDDVERRIGAPRIDEACTGTTMRDYLRVTDLAHVPDELVAIYDDETASEGKLVYSMEEKRDR
ncbi:MAG: phytanoyl-CoA dioxygenase family protein [Nitrospira sp.]|nr:phytanoyl-CoA dioxygenase family protein [Nitrospira sp.]MDH5347968.1 phytanoyl-CoA dioxygenase family protein [Nitrospira sp.]MDH5726750.1 phytanoyl-CoA dioxygenase family protein [Nitrospira sp.]